MGALLSALQKKDVPQAVIDLENAVPSAAEENVYNMLDGVLQRSQLTLQQIQGYQGCQDVIRQAMAHPSPENEMIALDRLIEHVRLIKNFYQFSQELERSFPVLLESLAINQNDEKKMPNKNLEDQQALAKQCAKILDFALQFDNIRMMRPSLSNDFAYYRRLLPKHSKSPKIEVREDEANVMALFTAEHIPMTHTICKAAGAAYQQNARVSTVLSGMANACLYMLKNKRVANETALLCARAMSGAIVVYDHVDPLGVFYKRSPVDVKSCIVILKKEYANDASLVNAIHYSTKHYKDDSTPSAIRDLLE